MAKSHSRSEYANDQKKGKKDKYFTLAEGFRPGLYELQSGEACLDELGILLPSPPNMMNPQN